MEEISIKNQIIYKTSIPFKNNNEYLEELLSLPSEPLPIDIRLKKDFLKNSSVFLGPSFTKGFSPGLTKGFSPVSTKTIKPKKSKTIPLQIKKYTHLSSPLLSDNYLIPNKISSKNKSKKKKYKSFTIIKLPKKYTQKSFFPI